jgi:hypothetical protein
MSGFALKVVEKRILRALFSLEIEYFVVLDSFGKVDFWGKCEKFDFAFKVIKNGVFLKGK